jgi:outer membrane protein assembly factor BamB
MIMDRYQSSRRSICIALALGCIAVCNCLQAQSPWPTWRGPNGNGTALPGNYPTEWSDSQHIAWKIDLPGRGASTPIVLNDRLYLTYGKQGTNTVACLDTNGTTLWEKPLGMEKEGKHKKASGSNSSPITDGKNIFVYFKSGDLASFTPEGLVAWSVNLQELYGPDSLWWDLGTSPVLTNNAVVVAVMQTGPSFLVALDKSNGRELWKADRWMDVQKESNQSYTTPVLAESKRGTLLLTVGADHATAHTAAEGKLLWKVGGFNQKNDGFYRSIASPVVVGDLVLCPYERGGSLTAVRYAPELSEAQRVAWRIPLGADVPTPAVDQNKIYLLSDKGQVTCLTPEKGEQLWSVQLPKSNKAFSSSPMIANGYIYCTREDTTTFVLSLRDRTQVSENRLEGFCVATPVFASDRIYIRTYEKLYCIK